MGEELPDGTVQGYTCAHCHKSCNMYGTGHGAGICDKKPEQKVIVQLSAEMYDRICREALRTNSNSSVVIADALDAYYERWGWPNG